MPSSMNPVHTESPTPQDEGSGLPPTVARGHEPITVNVRIIGIALVGLLILVVVTVFLMWGLFEIFDTQAIEQNPEVNDLRVFLVDPPEPMLSPDQPAQRKASAKRQQQWLGSEGKGRIDLEAAKQRVMDGKLNAIRFETAAERATDDGAKTDSDMRKNDTEKTEDTPQDVEKQGDAE